LVYDLYVLATAIELLRNSEDFGQTEVLKTAALVKMRAIHNFFFAECQDSIKMAFFDCYSPSKPQKSPFAGGTEQWLTKQSIGTFVVHLDKARVTKKFEKDDKWSGKKKGDDLAQPKSDKGNHAVVEASIQLMIQAHDFVDSILHNPDFPRLSFFGQKYWRGFNSTLDGLV
jgi:hypothetical protein